MRPVTRDEHEAAIGASYAALAELEASGLDAREANASAGVAVALDVAQLLEAMGARPSAADVLTMAAAARTERSPAGAMAVASRLRLVADAQRRARLGEPPLPRDAAGPGSDALPAEVLAADVGAIGVGLVETCLEAGDGPAADAALEAVEDAGLVATPPSSLLEALARALNGRPRRRQVRSCLFMRGLKGPILPAGGSHRPKCCHQPHVTHPLSLCTPAAATTTTITTTTARARRRRRRARP